MAHSCRLSGSRVVCLVTLLLATRPRLASGVDSCPWSCRYRAASRIPTVFIPLSLAKCTVPAKKHCIPRNVTSSVPATARTALFVAMTTIPPRAGRPLQRAVDSLFTQRRLPDRVVVSASSVYKRFPSQHVNLTALAKREKLETLNACADAGPGTKLLCALPRLRELAAATGAPSDAFAVLLDDDLRYRPWALQWLERAINDDTSRVRHAYSYDVYTITPEGRAVTGGLYRGLLVGAGHALYAMRVSELDGVEDFFGCVRALEPRATYHDDVILSMFLQDVRGHTIYRLGGTPYETAARSFPDVHETTVSYLSAGALIRLAHDAAAAVDPSTTNAANAANAPPSTGKRHAHSHSKRSASSAAKAEARATTDHGSSRRTLARGDPKGESAAGANATGTGIEALVGVLEGGAALLRNGSTIDEARSLYSRLAVTKAMGMVRAKILSEGLCGVRKNASLCVGEWCEHKGPWGLLGGKAMVD